MEHSQVVFFSVSRCTTIHMEVSLSSKFTVLYVKLISILRVVYQASFSKRGNGYEATQKLQTGLLPETKRAITPRIL